MNINGGFGHSKRARLNVTMATWNTEVMATQNGVKIEEGVDSVTYYDVMEASSAGVLKTKYKALGATGAEIGFLYKVADDGTYEKVFKQGATGTSGNFAYAAESKTFSFETSETPVAGEMYACAYEFKPKDSQRIHITGDALPETVNLTAYGLAKDICNGKLYYATLEGQAQIDGNWNFDVSADGEPAVQALNMEFVKGCVKKDLYVFTIFTDEESE